MMTRRLVTAGALIGLLGPGACVKPASRAPKADGTEIKVMISGGLTAAYLELGPRFEAETGHRLVTSFGPSMGTAPDAIPVRLERGEPADALIMVGYALEWLVDEGKVERESTVDLARSKIGMVVQNGAELPDISTVDAFVQVLLEAESIAYSDSASGRYVSGELFERLGIADQVTPKSREIVSERVGKVVARGEAELGFQQVSELLPIEGVQFVGEIPAEVQKITVFSAGIPLGAHNADAGRALIDFMASAEVTDAIERSGLEPIAAEGVR
ncbi:MAG: substrate-binding domain-containing protein [Myxococcota bacterium]